MITPRLAGMIQKSTERMAYSDKGCIIRDVPGGTFDAYNHPVTTETKIPVDCSFTDKPTREIWKEHVNLDVIEAEVRFSSVTPESSDRFEIVERFGAEITNNTYEVVGISARGAFGYVVALKAVSV